MDQKTGDQKIGDQKTGGRLGGSITIGGDLVVGRLGFGAMRLTGPGIWGEPEDPDQARQVLRRAVELGVTLIDTADSYGPDVSERLIGEVLHPFPEGLVVASKGGLTRSGPGRWERNGRPEHLRKACEGSLKRLNVARIDLYQLHARDPEVPLEESLGALAELQAEGKIRHIGVSNVSIDELRRASGVVAVASVQNRYNVGDRRSESVVDLCEQERMVFLPWAPIQDLDSNNVVRELADRHGATPRQIVLAWLLARSPAILPIPGTGRERSTVMDAGDLLEVLIHAGVQVVLSGHKHVPYSWKLENMFIVNAGTASTTRLRGNTRPCYNIIEVENGRVRVFRKYPFKERELAVDFDSVTHEYSRYEERIDSEVAAGQELALAPVLPGDIVMRTFGAETVYLTSGCFLASSASVDVDTKWGGAKTFFSSQGLFLLKVTGPGELAF